MVGLTDDYTGHSILIYDMDGNHLNNTVVKEHNKADKQIRVGNLPASLGANADCKLLILTSPAPCEYQGKVKKVGGAFYIAMFQGQLKENRTASRFNVNTPALIDIYVSEGQQYKLLNPVKVVLKNISTSGVRFVAPFYSFNDRDKFRMHMTISGSNKQLIAEVMNHLDNEPVSSDYGCRFV
ncbi:MAG: PilZ domain-containing protein [Oscillospiraceae bacterium]|nr:PilZ domain-containing protein [Oscillospiraceae bacterium]